MTKSMDEERYDFNKHLGELPPAAPEHVLDAISELKDELSNEAVVVESAAISAADNSTSGEALPSEHLAGGPEHNQIDAAETLGISNGVGVVDAVALNIADGYSQEAADAFLSNPDFQDYNDNTQEVQRGLVNRVLVRKLLVHRADNPESVVDIILCLVPDGDVESWMTVFKIAVLPYLKANNVRL